MVVLMAGDDDLQAYYLEQYGSGPFELGGAGIDSVNEALAMAHHVAGTLRTAALLLEEGSLSADSLPDLLRQYADKAEEGKAHAKSAYDAAMAKPHPLAFAAPSAEAVAALRAMNAGSVCTKATNEDGSKVSVCYVLAIESEAQRLADFADAYLGEDPKLDPLLRPERLRLTELRQMLITASTLNPRTEGDRHDGLIADVADELQAMGL